MEPDPSYQYTNNQAFYDDIFLLQDWWSMNRKGDTNKGMNRDISSEWSEEGENNTGENCRSTSSKTAFLDLVSRSRKQN